MYSRHPSLAAAVYLWFLHDLDEVHVALHWVDDNQHVSEISWDDATTVVPGVL